MGWGVKRGASLKEVRDNKTKKTFDLRFHVLISVPTETSQKELIKPMKERPVIREKNDSVVEIHSSEKWRGETLADPPQYNKGKAVSKEGKLQFSKRKG